MAIHDITEHELKQVLKEAIIEVLEERRDLLRDIVEEVLAEYELVEEIREVKKGESVLKRPRIFAITEGEA